MSGCHRHRLLTICLRSLLATVTVLLLSAGGQPDPSMLHARPAVANDGTDRSIPIIKPVELRVPAAGIDAMVQQVGMADDGSMDVPSNFTDVAWFSPGYAPGEFGNAVFDGHVSNVDSEAVFFYVEDLRPGATIYINGDDGTVLSFRITDVESYGLDSAPLDRIFGPSDWPGLVLITCGGGWHEDLHLFDHRTVVYASLFAVSSR